MFRAWELDWHYLETILNHKHNINSKIWVLQYLVVKIFRFLSLNFRQDFRNCRQDFQKCRQASE